MKDILTLLKKRERKTKRRKETNKQAKHSLLPDTGVLGSLRSGHNAEEVPPSHLSGKAWWASPLILARL